MKPYDASTQGWQIMGPKPKVVRVKLMMDRQKYNERYGIGRMLPVRDSTQIANRIADAAIFGGRGAYGRRFRKLRSGRMRLIWRKPRYLVRNLHHMRGRGLYMGGRGGFWGDLAGKAWNASEGLRNAIGARARAGEWGSWGSAAGHAAKALGIGAYETKSNALVNGGGDSVVPTFTPSSDDDSVVVSSSEFVTDIYAPATAGAFQIQQFALNPGVALTFPWLSQIAANYEEYEFAQLLFTYKTNVTDFVSTNGQVGTVIMATQYNSDQPAFKTKTEMMHYAGAADSKTTENLLSGVECDPTKSSGAPGKYIRAGPVPQGEDNKTYDLGTLNLALANTPALFNNQAMGELHVSYTVRLRKQRFYSTQGKAIMRDAFVGKCPVAGTGVAPSAMVVGVGQQNRINGLLEYDAAASKWKYTFPAGVGGTWKIRCTATDTSAGNIVGMTTTAPTITNVNDIYTAFGWASATEGVGRTPINTASSEHHYAITTPASAGSVVDNAVWFTFASSGGSTTTTLQSFQIDVEAYNIAFNQPATNNMVVDSATTGLTIAWP